MSFWCVTKSSQEVPDDYVDQCQNTLELKSDKLTKKMYINFLLMKVTWNVMHGVYIVKI